ncbi:MAG: hypothetical protein ACTS3F_11450 [Phycisphaerales bacterium]
MPEPKIGDDLATPADRRKALGLGVILPAAILLLVGIGPAGTAYTAIQSPGCPWALSAALGVVLALPGIALAWVSIRSLIDSRFARITAGVILSLLILLFYAVGAGSAPRMAGGSDVIRVSSALRGLAKARVEAMEKGIDDSSTVLVSMHAGIVRPSLFFDFTCPNFPRMPRADEFNYGGITAEDAASQRVTREAIIEAANRSLGDKPWERIGLINSLRAWPTVEARDRRHPALIVLYAFHESEGHRSALVGFADSSVNLWSDPIDEDERQRLADAIYLAERLGIAPPPPELIDFVNPAATTR